MNHTINMYKLPYLRSDVPYCPEHPFAGGRVVVSRWTLHAGELICPKCHRVIGWANAPADAQPVQDAAEVAECA